MTYINPDYISYEQTLLDLCKMMSAGQLDTHEADDLRGKLDQHWVKLSKEEIAFIDQASSDLYQIDGDEMFIESPEPVENFLSKVQIALSIEDWNMLLLLMSNRSSDFGDTLTATYRATAYEKLGHPRIADVFKKYAEGKRGTDCY